MVVKDFDSESYLRCVQLSLMYMMRPHCHMLQQRPKHTWGKRWESHIRFINAIFENLKAAGIDENGEFYKTVVARVVLACRSNLERRLELLGPCEDAIDYLIKHTD